MAVLGVKLHPTNHGFLAYQALACSGDHRARGVAVCVVLQPSSGSRRNKRQRLFIFGFEQLIAAPIWENSPRNSMGDLSLKTNAKAQRLQSRKAGFARIGPIEQPPGRGVRQPSGAFAYHKTFKAAEGCAHSKTLTRLPCATRHYIYLRSRFTWPMSKNNTLVAPITIRNSPFTC
jgi:hypothetical protein